MSKRRGPLVLLTAVLAVLAVMVAGAPAYATTTYQQITNDANRKCIDVATQNNYTVQLWSCNGQSQQKWSEGDIGYAFVFANQRTGACLDVAGHATNAGVPVVMATCSASWFQQWRVVYANNGSHGWYQQLQNVGSGLCLDLYNNSSTNGTILQQYWCYDTSAQYWNL